MRLPKALLWGVALALGLSLLVGLGRDGGGTDLLSTRASGVAGIERWEKRALSGGSKGGLDGEATTTIGREGRGTRARDVEAMVQEWEDKTLSGRKGGLGAAESGEGEEPSLPRPAGDGGGISIRARARGMRKKKQHEAMARHSDVPSPARATATRSPAPIQETAVAPAPVMKAEPTATSSSSSSASKQEESSIVGSKSSRMEPTRRQDEAPRVPRAAPAVSAKPAAVKVDGELDSKAKAEERKASQLVSYADRVAQRIIKEKALDAMKRWLSEQRQRVAEQRERHAASTHGSSRSNKGRLDHAKHSVHRAAVHGGTLSIDSDEERLKRVLDKVQDDTRRLDQGDGGERNEAMAELTADVREAKRVGERVAEDKQAKRAAEPKAPAVAAAAKAAPSKAVVPAAKAVPAPKPAAKKTQDERIRQEYEAWRKSEVHDYAKEHNLFSANEFCNSRQNADHPTVGEMIKLFGDQWRTMALSNPEVATLAAVSPCLSALGVETPGVATKSVYAQAWKKGPLAGKEGAVKKCAGGDRKACVEIAKDPEALRELKALIPHKLISKK